MVKEIGGDYNAKGKKFALVISRFHDFLTTKLKDGAIDCLLRHGALEKDITVIWVTGTYEIPYAAAKVADPAKYDSVICLGVVIRGQTPHFDYIAAEAAKGIAKIGMDKKFPVIYGIVTAETLEQAIERCGTKQGNRGFQAGMAAIEMADLLGKL
jgi:6,7-dimethyl-8-ribityllumazine synthase